MKSVLIRAWSIKVDGQRRRRRKRGKGGEGVGVQPDPRTYTLPAVRTLELQLLVLLLLVLLFSSNVHCSGLFFTFGSNSIELQNLFLQRQFVWLVHHWAEKLQGCIRAIGGIYLGSKGSSDQEFDCRTSKRGMFWEACWEPVKLWKNKQTKKQQNQLRSI